MTRTRLCCLVLIRCLFPCQAGAQNWPQWRGPSGTGASREKGFPLRWDARTNVLWKVALPGPSASTPIIWGTRIFVCSPAEGRNRLICFDQQGKELWGIDIGEFHTERHRKTNTTSASPVTDGEHIYVHFGTGDIACVDFRGRLVWRKDIGRARTNFGVGASPVNYKDLLIVAVLYRGPSYILALDKQTGAERWKTMRPSDAPGESQDAYATPFIRIGPGRAELIVTGADFVNAYDPGSGKELWRCSGLNSSGRSNFRAVSSPVVVGGLALVPFPRGRSMMAVRLGGEGDISQTHRAWTYTGQVPDAPTIAAAGNRAYLCRDRGIVACVDIKNGKEVWAGRIGGNFTASPVVADGKLYALSEDGTTTVLAARDEFKILATNPLGEYSLSSPALSRGRLFIRTSKTLYCIAR